MAEQVPHLPTPYELAMEAAEGANIAHDVLQRATAARAALETAESFGIDGVVIKPEAYAAVDGEITQAQENLDVFGRIVTAVMPPLEGVAEAAPDIPQAKAQQPAKQPRKGTIRLTTQELIEQKEQSRQRHSSILYEVLKRADDDGNYKDENMAEVIRSVVGATQPQWNRSITMLSQWGCITTELNEKTHKINEIGVDWDAIDVTIADGKIAPFPDGLTATEIMERKAAAAHNPAPEASLPRPPARSQGHRLSAKVRRQVERDRQANPGQAAPDPSELSELEQEIVELRRDANSLTEDQHFLLEPMSQVALAFLDATILAGSPREDLGKQLMAVTDLPEKTVIQAYGAIRGRNFLEFVEEGEVRIPKLTQAFRHYLRNIIQGAKENS